MDKVYLDAEAKSVRDDFFDKVRDNEKHKSSFSPFVLSGMVFFSILICIVVIITIVMLVVLKEGFKGLSGVF